MVIKWQRRKLKVKAEVCLHCGERLYSQEIVKRFDDIRKKLELKEVANFQPIGQSFQVAAKVLSRE